MAAFTPVPQAKAGSKRLLVTMGDPAGIGPEVVLKALGQNSQNAQNLPPSLGPDQLSVTLVGNAGLMQQTYQQLRGVLPKGAIANPADFDLIDVPLPLSQADQIKVGQGNAASGDLSFRTLQTAIAHCLAEGNSAIVTAPIAKSAWHQAGHTYPGQTEVLAAAAETDRFGMLFVARSPHTGWTLRCLLATTHIPLRAVPDTLTPALMTRKLDLLVDCLQQQFGLAQPRVAVAGLNPHSGEQGQLGREELDWLHPWLVQQQNRLPQVTLTGLVPPDTLWVKPAQAWYGSGAAQSPQTPPAQPHDAYLALYHDQGLIPVKLLAFDRAVNTTIGLPFIRTSPDHGTAFDIAGRGVAQAESLLAALHLATELSTARQPA